MMAPVQYEEELPSATSSSGEAVVEPEKKSEKPFWLHAWRDHLADVKAYSNCIDLADVNGDDEFKLIVGDASKKLKVFGGTNLLSVNPLMAPPVAVATFYLDYADMVRRPCVAVATGPYIFTYKSFRPMYKFSLPPVELHATDLDVWAQLKAGSIQDAEAFAKLEEAKVNGVVLSTRSTDLLAIETQADRSAFISLNKQAALVQLTCVTCMSVLLKDGEELTSRGCLVVGTENNFIYVLHNNASEIIKKVKLPATPVHLITAGTLDVDYRIIVSCRNGLIYAIKNGVLQASIIEPEAQPVGIARYENQIAVGTMANTMHYFHLKGKRQGTIYFPSSIHCMCSAWTGGTRQAKAVIVSLANGEVRVYAGKVLLNVMNVYEPVTAMKFGRYGREDASLVLVLKSGTVLLKMLPRTVSLEANTSKSGGPPPEQDIPLRVPKKTSLYVEQTEREKKFGVEMHRTFQRDLCKLRLTTAKAYAKMLTDGKGMMSHSSQSSVRLTAHVQGLGPLFLIKLNVQNIGTKPLLNTTIIFTYVASHYRMSKGSIQVPALVPALVYTFEAPVECVDEAAGAGVIGVHMSTATSSIPIITAQVNMPIADFLLTQA